MRVGVTVPGSGHLATPNDLAAVARRAEQLGFDSLWVTDHVALPLRTSSPYPYSADGRITWDVAVPWLDCFVALTWAAAVTDRVRLGTSVLVLPMRPTLLVAKLAASVDHMSDGRLVLGVGSGWLAEEFQLLGQSFHDRGRRTTEAVRLLRRCWSGSPVEPGDDVDVPVPFVMGPPPRQGAGLPVLIGGHSDAALRRVAEVGDGWHPTNRTPVQVEEALGQLRRYVDDAGRAWSEIQISVRPGGATPITGELAQTYKDLGAHVLVADVDYRSLSLPEALERLQEIARDLGLPGDAGA